MSNHRGDLVAAISKASSFAEQARLVSELDAFDADIRAQAQVERDLDLASQTVAQTLTPVRVHEMHSIASDWIGDFEPQDSGTSHHAAIAEGAMWFARVSADVKADHEEFGVQAEGFMRREASKYGEQSQDVYDAGLAYLGFLWRREAASGLDQIQQTVDPHDNPKPTQLNTEVFDNFADEVAPENAGVVGTETSERAPLLQEIEQEGAGQGQPEKPGGHSTNGDFSNSYSEVPALQPGQMAARGSLSEDWDQPSVAIAQTYTMDDFRHEAASGLDEIQQVVNPHEDPKPTALPTQVAFPWLLGPDAYGNEDDNDDDDDEGNRRHSARISRDCTNGNHTSCSAGTCGCGCHDSKHNRSGACADGDHHECQMGSSCSCKCHNGKRGSKQAAQRGPSYDPSVVDTLPLNGTHTNPQYYYDEGYDHGLSGSQHMGYGGRDKAVLYGTGYNHGKADKGKTSARTSDADHAALDAEWHRSFDALKAAGLEADADHPIAADYRAASDAVNHANRSRDWSDATGKTSSRKQADMFGNSDLPHAVPQENVANTPETTTNPNSGYPEGYADAREGNHPTYSDASSSVPSHVRDYSKGYADGIEAQQEQIVHEPVPSMATASKTSSKFVKQASFEDPEFTKGYRYASKWVPGTPLVTTGSVEFESGLYAGVVDNPKHRDAFAEAHQRWAAKDEKYQGLQARMEVHAAYTAHLADSGIDVLASVGAKNTPFGTRDACSKCGGDIEYVGRKADPAKEFLKINRGSGWWDRGGNFGCPEGGTHSRGKTAGTSSDLDTMDSSASPDAGGNTPINGPGQPGPLAGQFDAAAPGGPSPYNGAAPFGSPVVPTGPAAPKPGSNLINDVVGGPADGNVNARAMAFRRTVQANLLANNKKG